MNNEDLTPIALLQRTVKRSSQMRIIYLFMILYLLAVTGCATNKVITSNHAGVNLLNFKNVYLVRNKSDEEIYNIIKSRLEMRHFNVKCGPELQPPYDSDVVVSYSDMWVWDFSSYMNELTITFRNPLNYYTYIYGNSKHSSLGRLSSTEMVDEVLNNIFLSK